MTGAIFADLHNHTLSSDGDLKSLELILAARETGIQALGITDHDTLAGLADALVHGDAAGIEVVPGVEISVRFTRPWFTGTLHVLAYFSRHWLQDPAFVAGFETLLAGGRGEGLVRARIEKINRIFGPGGTSPMLVRDLEFEEIAAYGSNISRRHFALALNERFNITDPAAVNQIIGNASPAYLPSGVDLPAVKAFLRRAPVVAVLAHPAAGSFPGKGHYKEVLPKVAVVERLLPEFLDAGIQGIEVYYPGHSAEHQALMLEWAARHDLLVTGGSDCHDLSQRPPGVAGIGERAYRRLTQRIQAMQNQDMQNQNLQNKDRYAMRRAEKEIKDRERINEFIKGARVCRLAMADGDQPYVVPLNFGYDGTHIYFHSAAEGRKLEILKKNPKVCFVIDEMVKLNKNALACEWGADFISVIGEGTAEILERTGDKIQGLNCIMAQYSGRTFEFPLESLAKTAVIRVAVTRLTCKGSG